MIPRRVRLRTRESRGSKNVARPTRWGNPYPVKDYGRPQAIALYLRHLGEHPELVAAARRELAGHNLACFCPPDKACHADLLLVLANL